MTGQANKQLTEKVQKLETENKSLKKGEGEKFNERIFWENCNFDLASLE